MSFTAAHPHTSYRCVITLAAVAVCMLYIEGQCILCAQIEEEAELRWAYDAEWDDPVSGNKTAFTLLHWPRSSEAELVSVASLLLSWGPFAITCKDIQINSICSQLRSTEKCATDRRKEAQDLPQADTLRGAWQQQQPAAALELCHSHGTKAADPLTS
jgi:hypothetical protein